MPNDATLLPNAGMLAARHPGLLLATLRDASFISGMGWEPLALSKHPFFAADPSAAPTAAWLSLWMGLLRLREAGEVGPEERVEARLQEGLRTEREIEPLTRGLLGGRGAVHAWLNALSTPLAPAGSAETQLALSLAMGLVSWFQRALELDEDGSGLDLAEQVWRGVPQGGFGASWFR